MRTIDADKLKAIFQDPLHHSTIKDYGEVMRYTFVMDIIDEAPTVYPEEISKLIETCIRELPQLIEAITKNLPQIIEAATKEQWLREEDNTPTEERTKGEWKPRYGEAVKYGCECSICKNIDWMRSNFCSNCGADMRKGDRQ